MGGDTVMSLVIIFKVFQFFVINDCIDTADLIKKIDLDYFGED